MKKLLNELSAAKAEIRVLKNLKTYEVATENKRLRVALEHLRFCNKTRAVLPSCPECEKIAQSALDGKGGEA